MNIYIICGILIFGLWLAIIKFKYRENKSKVSKFIISGFVLISLLILSNQFSNNVVYQIFEVPFIFGFWMIFGLWVLSIFKYLFETIESIFFSTSSPTNRNKENAK